VEMSGPGISHVPAGAGEAVWLLGARYEIKAVGEDTGGAYGAWETFSPPGGSPPPHQHHHEDELFYILEGELEFVAGDDVFTAGAGSFVHVPKGMVHTFKSVGTVPARFLGIAVPAGFEQFFIEAGEPATDPSTPPTPDGPPDVARLVAIAAKHGCEILLPSGA
jgi:mannose-6-phosphate isomerase-like protein (cupin superfamily)